MDAFGTRLTKRVDESRLYDFDFGTLGDTSVVLQAPHTITSENQDKVAASTNVTIGTPVPTAAILQARISGGTAGELYKLKATADDANGNTLVMFAWLEVEDVPSSIGLTVEDGTGVAGADSYLSLAEADAYWNARRGVTWLDSDPFAKEAALREATQYIGGQYDFVGSVVSNTQALAWPRNGGEDDEGRSIASNVVHQSVKDATAELALEALSARLMPSLERGGAVKREKVGSLEVEYQDAASPRKTYPFIDRLLRGIVKGTFSNTRKLVRA